MKSLQTICREKCWQLFPQMFRHFPRNSNICWLICDNSIQFNVVHWSTCAAVTVQSPRKLGCAQRCLPMASGSEDDQADQTVPSDLGCTSSAGAKWPISVAHSKPCQCCLCSAKSTDPNPLAQDLGEAEDMLATRPWAKYRKVPQHKVRVPEGKCCLPCYNVFRLLGKHRKHKSYQDYYKHISQRQNQHEHKDFLAAVKQWLKQHLENPDKFKLHDKEELLKTQRELVISKKQGGRITGPKKQFVLSSHWDTARHGEWDPSKEVEAWIDGAYRKGVWRSVGQEGVYDFEAYEDTGVEERVIEDDGKQEIFAEEAFQAKKQAALDTLHKQAKDREATSVKAKENDMTFTDLVQVARSFGDRSSSSAAAAAETKTAEDEQAQAVEESSSSSTSSSSGDEAAVGLDLLSGAAPQKSNADHAEKPKAKPKPKAKDTAKTTKTASTAPKTGKASSQVTAAPSKSQGSSALAGESMGPGPGMLSLDGRASRTLKSLETAIEQAQESISKVNYDDQPLSTSQLKDFKAEATQRMAVLNSAAKKAKETLTRVGKSNNKDSFQIQMDKLQGLAALASAGSKLLAQVIAPTLDADAYISAHEEVASNGGKLGPLYWLKLVVANGQKELLYGKYSGFCEAFVLSKEQHDKPINKLETLMGKDEAAKRCAVEVENRMLASLRAIPASELALLGAGKTAADLGSEAPRLNESLDFAAAMLEACYEHSEEFMAAELKESVRTVQCFLGQDHVGALLEQVSALSSNRLVAMPALQRFFLQHDTGKSLFATAQLRVEHCDKEKEFQDKLDLLEKAVKHLAAWQKQSLPEAESGVAAVHKRIEPAVEALEVVKQTAFFADMKKKKQEHASNRLLPDLERLEEQLGLRSSEMVWLICKENMENHLNYFSNALEKECMVDLGHGKSGLINLDEILLSFKATAFVSLKVWDKLPSAAAAVKQYKEASELAANVAQYVFQKHAAFSQMPSGGKAVEPETLHKWKVSGFTLVQPYVPEEVAKRFETMFVAVVEAELATVFSKGLDSVAPIVSKCVKGLLGAGLSRQIREETMQRIPASHRLKDLVDLFADCRASWLVHRPTSYVPTFPCLAGFLAEASTALGAGAKQVSACRLACRAWPSWLQ